MGVTEVTVSCTHQGAVKTNGTAIVAVIRRVLLAQVPVMGCSLGLSNEMGNHLKSDNYEFRK